MVVIYKATNTINGKPYIGFDSDWPARKHDHLRDSFNPRKRSYFFVFHKAIRKYGSDAFTWEIIHKSEDVQYTKNVMESRLIQENNSHYLYGHGYNMTLGGEGATGCLHGPSFRKACSDRMMGNRMNLGVKRTPEQNHRNSIQRKGLPLEHLREKITCPQCGKYGNSGNMKRWHFNNCKVI